MSIFSIFGVFFVLFSRLCVQVATDLAHNKTIDELQKINMVTIMVEVGQLAEITLRRQND